MGLFDSTESERDEVVIEAPDNSSSGETRLGNEVESSLIDDSGSETSDSGSNGSEIDLEDIHRQNETIIDLLEQLVDQRDSSSSRKSDRDSASKSSSKVTSRGSDTSNRVTDREDSGDESIGDGMNELL